jgi:hypothetical protein
MSDPDELTWVGFCPTCQGVTVLIVEQDDSKRGRDVSQVVGDAVRRGERVEKRPVAWVRAGEWEFCGGHFGPQAIQERLP